LFLTISSGLLNCQAEVLADVWENVASFSPFDRCNFGPANLNIYCLQFIKQLPYLYTIYLNNLNAICTITGGYRIHLPSAIYL